MCDDEPKHAAEEEDPIFRAQSAPESKVRDVADSSPKSTANSTPPRADQDVHRSRSFSSNLERKKKKHIAENKSPLSRLHSDPNDAEDVADLMAVLSNTHQGQHVVLQSRTLKPPPASTPGATLLPMWPQQAPVTHTNTFNGLFSLAWCPAPRATGYIPSMLGGSKAKPSIVCTLTGACTHLSGDDEVTLQLAPDTALVLDSSCDGVIFSNLKISGGIVVCHRANCAATFREVTFDRCTLVVLAGARATLEKVTFTDMHACKTGLSIYVEGSNSEAFVQGGSITGGLQGATVQGGARLEAVDLSISQVSLAGVEVKDLGSSLVLSGCSMHEFTHQFQKVLGTHHVCGVHVHNNSSATLSALTISGMIWGIHVRTAASATLLNCTIADTKWEGVVVSEGASGTVGRCTLSGSKSGHGMFVGGEGSSVSASDCNFLCNARCGAAVFHKAQLTATACKTTGNKMAGYQAEKKGVMELTSCLSDCDYRGCAALEEGVLIACMVAVSSTEDSGIYVNRGGVAKLTECTATECGEQAVSVRDSRSHVEAVQCKVFGFQNGALQSELRGQNAVKEVLTKDGSTVVVSQEQNVSVVEPEKGVKAKAGGHDILKVKRFSASLELMWMQDCRVQQNARDGHVLPDEAVLMQLCEFFSDLE